LVDKIFHLFSHHSETDADPHNSNRGFFFAHVGWLMLQKHPEVIKKGRAIDMSDVLADPVIQFHQKWVNEALIEINSDQFAFSHAHLAPSLSLSSQCNSLLHLTLLRPNEDDGRDKREKQFVSQPRVNQYQCTILKCDAWEAHFHFAALITENISKEVFVNNKKKAEVNRRDKQLRQFAGVNVMKNATQTFHSSFLFP
jgi:hypothetical protein